MAKSAAANPSAYSSKLKTARERFLVQVMVHALETGWRTADDFLRHFPPKAIIESLAENTELRARLLVKAAKVHEKLAAKKSVASGAEDLTIALEEGLCEPQEVLEVYDPDARVRHLDTKKIWTFVTEGDFWSKQPSDPTYDRALSRMVFTIDAALKQELITLQDLGDGLSFEEIAKRLPEQRLRDLVLHALKSGREGAALDEKSLLEIVPLAELLSHMSLDQIWPSIVLVRVAGPQSLADDVKGVVAPQQPKKQPASKSSTKASAAASAAAPAPAPAPKPAAAEAEAKPKAKEESQPKVTPPEETVISDVKDEELSFGDDDDARKTAAARLSAMDRLPPSHATIALPVLLSIESMYAELESATTDDDREAVIRESFPNEAHLRQAMLALIELLDPSIDTAEPLIRDADVDSLIKIVMFEERRRYERANPSQRPGAGRRTSRQPPPLALEDDWSKKG